jgi:hypothetical protein
VAGIFIDATEGGGGLSGRGIGAGECGSSGAVDAIGDAVVEGDAGQGAEEADGRASEGEVLPDDSWD